MAMYELLFAVATALVAATAMRLSAGSIETLATRLIAAVPIGLAFVVTETLALGLVGLGGDPWALSLGTLAFWVVVRLTVAAPAVAISAQIGDWWHRSSAAGRATFGASVAAVGAELAVQLWRPITGGDGLTYHSAQAVLWVQGGHPGSMHATIDGFPTQAYPRTVEVVIGWAYGIGRSPLAGTVLMVGIAALCVSAMVALLRELGAGWLLAGAGAAGCLVLPINVQELSGVYTDLPALGLLAVTGALCGAARREPRALGAALLAAALATGIKPTALPLAVVALIWAGSTQWRQVRAGWRRLVVPGALSLGLASVWYLADWVSFGSPLWPFSRFPAGRPVPLIWKAYGARFLHDPRQTLDAVGGHVYLHLLAGGLVLLAGALLIALVSCLPLGRAGRRPVLLGLLVLLAEVFLWADSEFTGVAHGDATLVITGLRYLTPAFPAAVVVLVLAARRSRVLRILSELIVVAATVLNLWELRARNFAFPVRPDLPVWVALIAVGALAAALIRSRRPLMQSWVRVVGLSAVAGVGVALTVGTSSYLDDYLTAARIHPYPDAAMLDYLRSQPAWADGSAPVAIGPVSYASLAGPHFQHRLSLIAVDESCQQVRAAAARGWLVMEPLRGQLYQQLDFLEPLQCMSDVHPAAIVQGGWRIYSPGS